MSDYSDRGGSVAQAAAAAADRVAGANGWRAFMAVVASGVVSRTVPAPHGMAVGPSAQRYLAASTCWGRV